MLGLFLSTNRFGLDVGLLRTVPSIEIDGGALTIFELHGTVKNYLHPQGSVRVYTVATIGLAHVSFAALRVSGQGRTERQDSQSESDFMLAGGLGFAIPVGEKGLHLFLEGRIGMVFNEGDNIMFAPFRIGFML
ncbi:hypothetical protein MJD09_17480 [bacterium]|nr:hypothetical protein [bacterium]